MNNSEIARGYVQKYPCSCHESGICWIVRHPKLKPPISYATKKEAELELDKLRKIISDGPIADSKSDGT